MSEFGIFIFLWATYLLVHYVSFWRGYEQCKRDLMEGNE